MGVENLSSLKLILEQVHLDEAIPGWLKPFRVLARDKKIEIVYETRNFSEKSSLAKIDQVKFPWVDFKYSRQFNSHFAAEYTKIKVILKQTSEEIFVVISDEGPGIPADVQKRMFDPYFQAQTEAGDGKSTGFPGICLTIAKEVVEAHNGSIRFSPNVPHGAMFTVTLPRLHMAGALA